MHKKLFVSLLILGTGLSSSLQAQPRKTIPNKVKLAFEAQYPQAANVEWEYEKKKQLWEIEFELEGKAYEAYYDTAGTWVKTEWNLNPDDLPDAV